MYNTGVDQPFYEMGGGGGWLLVDVGLYQWSGRATQKIVKMWSAKQGI